MRIPSVRPTRVAVGLLFALAGFGMVTSAVSARGTDLRSGRSGTLRDLVVRQAEELDRVERATTALRVSVAELAERTGGVDLTEARSEAEQLAPVAGTVAVRGPGVVVTLDDAPRNGSTTGVDPDLLVIHQQDVQAVVNALWRGGAEAIRVMDQRLVGTSAVKCVGNTLLLQGRVYSPPYVISAIGDNQRLLKALDKEPGVQLVQDLARAYGLGYTATSAARIDVPAFSATLGLNNAETL